MDAAELDELRALRARAYGPDADIAADPAAAQRLRDLEGRRQAPADAEAPGAVSRDEGPAEPHREPAATGAASRRTEAGPSSSAVAPSEIGDDAPAPAAPREPLVERVRRLGRSMKFAWAASLVLVAGIAAALAWAASYVAPVAVSHGAAQVATLTPSDTVEIPGGFYGAGPSSRVWTFHGLVIFETGGGFFGRASDTGCVAAVPATDLPDPDEFDGSYYSTTGQTWVDCSVGAFPATLQMSVGSAMPQELRDEYADARGIQFIVDGDRIGVFVDRG